MLADRIETPPNNETQPQTKLLTAVAVCEMFGGISAMSLWRWLADPEMGFPQPIYIAKRRYWRESELLGFIEEQAGEVDRELEK